MTRTISAHDARIDAPRRSERGRTHTNSRIDCFAYWSSSSRTHVSERPISRRSTLFRSARSFNRRYADFREQPTRSATSLVPATPPHSRRASRKSSSDHEGVYRPVSSSRSGGTDRVLMPLSYGAYGIVVPGLDITGRFITFAPRGKGVEPRSLGTRWRVRVRAPPGPGFEQVNP
jgi:hypothetical protein